jgi:hypothetical protein
MATESLIVASKVKTHIKSKGMMTSSDALEALSDKVYCMHEAAIARIQAHRRSTVKVQDLPLEIHRYFLSNRNNNSLANFF